MKTTKQLQALYDKAKGDKRYYSFENFKEDAKLFLKEVRNRNMICSMEVSRSGMTRKFNTRHYNMLLNICYNAKVSWDTVKVGGCGMDMHWHLIFSTCEDLATKKENETYNYNSLASGQPII